MEAVAGWVGRAVRLLNARPLHGGRAERFADDALAALHAIERGDVTLVLEESPNDVYIPYTASNGWRFGVFNDSGVWDYLEDVEAPDGRRSCYPIMYDDGHPLWRLFDYEVPAKALGRWHWGRVIGLTALA